MWKPKVTESRESKMKDLPCRDTGFILKKGKRKGGWGLSLKSGTSA